MDTELVVAAARAGDEEARDRLIAGYLPLVYNVVGRAMNGHPDVDDVVQEAMIRVVGGLGGLRDLSSFRSWLVAVAMNEVRRCWSARRAGTASTLDGMEQVADPAGDFVELTVLRLGLSGQRREVAEATRWLDEHDRDLLSLWWLEAAGRLTRAELATALELSPQHAAVRVQRMKEQLEASRTVVRALSATPLCPELAELTSAWDGRPSALWRKRIARHIRSCRECTRLGQDLVPAEGLLAGLVLVLPVHGFAGHGLLTGGLSLPTGGLSLPTTAAPASGATASPASGSTGAPGTAAPHSAAPASQPHGPQAAQQGSPGAPQHGGTDGAGGSHPRGARRAARRWTRHGGQVAGVLAVAVAVLGVVRALPDRAEPPQAGSAPVPTPETAAVLVTPTTQTPTVSASPAPSTATASPSPSPTPSATPSASPSPRSLERQLVDLINAERAKNGCRPLRVDPRLHTAAQQHSQDMAANHYFDHTDRQGGQPDSRITAAGYRWSRWGENIDQNRKAPGDVLNDWLDGAIHQQNILDCRFTDAGVGTAPSTGGLLWTLDLAASG
ncbi:sigma-70 family RNA polymerase sigma factor [Kitasatospora sp. NPDC056138]|uniref:sigma-70 family RNA polymerase sigma factor n=1 Tax=Kitasatospora sp. NPDC056138 TaxID=3345724 RepID=UPI0035DEE4D6